MTIEDFKKLTGGRKKLISETLEELEKDGLIITYRDRKGKLLMAKSNYAGLRKAYPKEYYRYFPDWIKEDEFIMSMTKD